MLKNNIYLLLIICLEIVLSGEECIYKRNFCLKCDPVSDLCLRCDNDVLIPGENGECIGAQKCTLGLNYCEECNTNGKICDKCEEGYFPDQNGGCSYTQNCQMSYKGHCLKCDKDYELIGENNKLKICKYLYLDDFKNCKEISTSEGLCQLCEEGFYLNSKDKKCIKTENCAESLFGVCTKCIKDYYLDKKEDKCKKEEKNLIKCQETLDSVNCEQCDENFYLGEDGLCANTNYCSKSVNNTCIECVEGYFLIQNYSHCCNDKNCFFGDTETGYCEICQKDYYIDNKDKKCKPNTEDNEFKYCKIAKYNICLRCDAKYFMGEDKKCSTTKYCLESKNGLCESCIENYNLNKTSHLCYEKTKEED